MKEGKKELRTQKLKKGFVERYKEMYQAAGKVIPLFIYVIITIPLFIAISYCANCELMGHEVYNYSDDIYNQIKKSIETNVIENVGIDKKALLEEFAEDEYVEIYKNGETILKCTRKIGYLKATVKATMSSNFHITDDTTNRVFIKILFVVCIFLGGIFAWMLFTTWVYVIIYGIVLLKENKPKRKTMKKKNEHTDILDFQEIPDTSQEATDNSKENPNT